MEYIHRLVIETAENGFLVYVNQDFSQGTSRPRPYVFESIASLEIFIEKSLVEAERKTQSKPSF